MRTKICLTTLTAIALWSSSPIVAIAQGIDSYQEYKQYCSPGAYQYRVQSPDCKEYQDVYGDRLKRELQEKAKQEQTTQVSKKSNNIRGYAGGAIGAYFPTQDVKEFGYLIDLPENPDLELNTGFGGNIFVGAMFEPNVGADVEFNLYGGGTEIDDIDYSQWSLFVNPRFIMSISKQNDVAIYLSPGLGISKGKLSHKLTDEESEDSGVEDGLTVSLEDDLSFALQVKLGLTFKLDKNLESFTQVKYFMPVGENTVDSLSTEVGLLVNF